MAHPDDPRRGPPPNAERRRSATGADPNHCLLATTNVTDGQRGALGVLATSVAQLDSLAALGADAELHAVVIPQLTWIAAVDRIAQRQHAALTVIDLRDQEVGPR